MKYFIAFLPLTICLIAASILMWFNKEGWGWLLLVSLCVLPSIKEEGGKSENNLK